MVNKLPEPNGSATTIVKRRPRNSPTEWDEAEEEEQNAILLK
jgi:hypothetical protein